MESRTNMPRLVSNDFISITMTNYVEDVNLPPTTILRAGLLLHKIRYSVSTLSKELDNDIFFQSEVFKSAPRLEEVLPLCKFVAEKRMLFTSTKKVREKALAVIRYTAELLFTCLEDKKIRTFIPLLESINTQFDAKNSAISLVCGDVSFEKNKNGGKSLVLRLGLIKLNSIGHWRELINGNSKRTQEAKAIIFWLLLHAKQNTLLDIPKLQIANTPFWINTLEVQRAAKENRKRKL